MIFGVKFSIIPNKIAIDDFVIYDPFDYAQDMFINYDPFDFAQDRFIIFFRVISEIRGY